MKLVLIGIQGAGKSTQGNLLSKQYAIPYLSSGHIFREMAKEKTQLGRWLKETLNSGALVPDDTTLEVVLTYLKKPEYAKGYILDGFPRTVPQAEAFNGSLDKVIYLKVSDKEALWRISGRADAREDETLQAIRNRIKLFHEVTQPVVDYYREQNKLVEVDGEVPVEEVYDQILAAL
ncbi:MAG: adenylate kinase [Candidatus Pacebacteria bacterium CG_4_10_14_0_8_um_filter_43_12]|nr:MAG: adenylate kinase [Candidatus Pacebacteria bacterium CG_4_10_14_0_8_um_filter_43_12]